MRVNRLPSLGMLSTSTLPPSSRAKSLEIESPSPVPPYFRFVVPSAWRKGSKITSCCARLTPMPVSMTENKSFPSASWETWSVTCPRSVNFSALERRFFKICSNRCRSVKTVSWMPESAMILNFKLFSFANGPKVASKLWKTFGSPVFRPQLWRDPKYHWWDWANHCPQNRSKARIEPALVLNFRSHCLKAV